MYRLHIPQSACRISCLPLVLIVTTFKHRYERTGAELLRNRSYILKPDRFPECSQEASALHARATVGSVFGKDHRPRHQAEDQKDEKNDFSDDPALRYQVRD